MSIQLYYDAAHYLSIMPELNCMKNLIKLSIFKNCYNYNPLIEIIFLIKIPVSIKRLEYVFYIEAFFNYAQNNDLEVYFNFKS